MEILEVILGAAIGCTCGYVAKNTMVSKDNASVQREKEHLYAEYEKLRNNYKEAKRTIEDLTTENKRLKKRVNERNDDSEELTEDLEDARLEIKKLKSQIEKLQLDLREAKETIQDYEIKFDKLKGE